MMLPNVLQSSWQPSLRRVSTLMTTTSTRRIRTRIPQKRIQCVAYSKIPIVYPGSLTSLKVSLSLRQSLSTSTTTATLVGATTPTSIAPKTSRRITATSAASASAKKLPALKDSLLFRYLGLKSYSDDELENVFDRIRQSKGLETTAAAKATTSLDNISQDTATIGLEHMQGFFQERLLELEDESLQERSIPAPDNDTDNDNEAQATQQLQRQLFLDQESTRIWNSFQTAATNPETSTLDQAEFCRIVKDKASTVDIQASWPVTASMVLVGASVGVITPAMPFVVEQLQLSASQYGLVVSAFALSKLMANIPSAIAVERYGRHPFMVHSLGLIALGVGGIGLASSFEELYLCRLLTGVGVSLLSGAATLMVTDLSTPLNRASTMAPIMSGFSAGAALGPALGGMLVDSIGLNPTFYVVGLSYLGVAAVNRTLLQETQRRPLQFAWQEPPEKKSNTASSPKGKESWMGAMKTAVGQWTPLLTKPSVQSILIMNAFYWFSLAGAQMTLMPLILTDAQGLNMTATEVGRVYMGMSLVQIVGNPVFGKLIDRIGKAPAIVTGCTLIALPMAALPLCQDATQVATVVGVWAMGSSMLSTAPLAYISDKTDDSERAQAIALLRTCGDAGFLAGASIIGAFADWSGLEQAMQASSALLLISTSWFGVRQMLSSRIVKASGNTTTNTTSNK